ncbi:hypothetical protein [Chitinophaga sp. sic0106]|uniref:hypothetical protein n=1 Tax=Chitinophaga sp. sic0106 TaxID=2854785 RepID=UPI001C46E5A6|nr:hypothetical protein [Chitinophaga sp. sic0106]MBV7533915.1 hypothetical protein [Chitinophaga sp. sic0106]
MEKLNVIKYTLLIGLLLFFHINVNAQRKDTIIRGLEIRRHKPLEGKKKNDIALLGKWDLIAMKYNAYHMQGGQLLEHKELSGNEMHYTAAGPMIDFLEFKGNQCMVKSPLFIDYYDYETTDSLKLIVRQRARMKKDSVMNTPIILFDADYQVQLPQMLILGNMTCTYMDSKTNVPVRMVYSCIFRRN